MPHLLSVCLSAAKSRLFGGHCCARPTPSSLLLAAAAVSVLAVYFPVQGMEQLTQRLPVTVKHMPSLLETDSGGRTYTAVKLSRQRGMGGYLALSDLV